MVAMVGASESPLAQDHIGDELCHLQSWRLPILHSCHVHSHLHADHLLTIRMPREAVYFPKGSEESFLDFLS